MSSTSIQFGALRGFTIEYKDDGFFLTQFYKNTSKSRRIPSFPEAVRIVVRLEDELKRAATQPEVIPRIVPSHRRSVDLSKSEW